MPDAEMLVAIGEVLGTPVRRGARHPDEHAAGRDRSHIRAGGLQALFEILEVLNDQFARAQESKRHVLHALCIAIAAATTLVLIALASIGGSYLEWDFSNPEYAVAGTMFHGFEWIFARVAPTILAGSIADAVASRK